MARRWVTWDRRVSRERVEEIRRAADLLEMARLASDGKVVKKGDQFYLRCPFHEEKTPSFTVNPERGLFHCFGCEASGDVFAFVMRLNRCGFPRAVELVERRSGIEPAQTRSPKSLPKREM